MTLDGGVLLLIDNYDSFTYNIAQYLGEMGVEQRLFRNDALSVDEAVALNPDGLLLSPGPCTPDETGVSMDLIGKFAGKIPILGVCLGHQCIGQFFGGKIIRAASLMHGKTSPIEHHGLDLFEGLPNPLAGTRYHSLLVDNGSFPTDTLEITAETGIGEIMGIRHRTWPIWGVQYHPESLATVGGKQLLKNFCDQL